MCRPTEKRCYGNIVLMQKFKRLSRYRHFSRSTRGVQKVLQLDHKEEWKCYKLHFIFQYNHHRVQCICNIFLADC